MAVHFRRPFGTSVTFTYGPLGFLDSPGLYYLSLGRTAFLFSLAFSSGLFALLIWAMRRTSPLPVAVATAYVVGGVSRLSSTALGLNVAVEDVLAVVAIICTWLLSREVSARFRPAIWTTLGIIVAVFSLFKSSLGVAVGVSLLLTLVFVGSQRLKSFLFLALGGIVAFGIAWFGTGNGLRNLVPFVKTSASVISGYAGAMGIEVPNRWYAYWLALLAVAIVILLTYLYSRRLQPRRAQIGIALVMLATLWFLFKEGFVRHDYHDLIFFVAAPLLLAAFPLRERLRATQLLSMLALVIVAAYVSGAMSNLLANPMTGIQNFSSEVTTLASSHRSTAVMEHSRRAMRRSYVLDGVTPEMVRTVQSHATDISPWEQSLVWAYPGITFDPLPVFQDYSAYTPSLDSLNADFLRSPAAPEYILRQGGTSIDGKDPYFEGPLTQLEIECRYVQVTASATWQLLQRGPDRCGRPTAIRTITTGFGHWVNVPTSSNSDAVVATFHVSEGLWSGVQGLLYKPPQVFLALNSAQNQVRFVTGTGPDLHILRPSPSLAYSPAFTPGDVGRLRLTVEDRGITPSGLTITFLRVPTAPPSGSRS